MTLFLYECAEGTVEENLLTFFKKCFSGFRAEVRPCILRLHNPARGGAGRFPLLRSCRRTRSGIPYGGLSMCNIRSVFRRIWRLSCSRFLRESPWHRPSPRKIPPAFLRARFPSEPVPRQSLALCRFRAASCIFFLENHLLTGHGLVRLVSQGILVGAEKLKLFIEVLNEQAHLRKNPCE